MSTFISSLHHSLSDLYVCVSAFRCPWPNCGREFNVNSNMRRHYRNHTAPENSHSRRWRRRDAPSLAMMNDEVPTAMAMRRSEPTPFLTSLQVSAMESVSDEESEDEIPTPMNEDDVDLGSASEETLRSQKISGGAESLDYSSRAYQQPYSRSHIRTRPSGSNYRSSTPSLSPPPSPAPTSRPSVQYMHPFAYPPVSTTLRPAFRSSTSPVGKRRMPVKEDQMDIFCS